MGIVSSMVGEMGDRNVRHHGTFEDLLARVRLEVDARLEWWLEARMQEAHSRGTDIAAVADSLKQLVLRGGKRLRAALLAIAYDGCGGQGGFEAVAPAGAALELLQGYLLAHDDWMDGDDIRRGGPSVPAMMNARFGAHGASRGISDAPPKRGQDLRDAASVLAGNLAAAWALQSMLELTLPAARIMLALQEFGRVEEEVVVGQLLDVCACARNACDVEAVYALKTASYTVRSPIVIGARLAGADEAQVAALVAFAEPLGIAFQLRDDVLGTFGDPCAMGKPSGSDLRKGKRTALVVEATRDAGAAEILTRVLGRSDAADDEVAAAVEAIEASGARLHVEERIHSLLCESLAALDRVGLTPSGLIFLAQAAVVLTQRDH